MLGAAPPFIPKAFAGLTAVFVMLSSFSIASAEPDYPWSCRDADAVLAAARKYSVKTSVLDWDERKINQAAREYRQCLNEGVDWEDRYKAGRGLTSVSEIRAFRYYLYAMNANISSASESQRRRFFRIDRALAIEQYTTAKKVGLATIQMARATGLDADEFAAWVQHNISDRLAELNATAFENLKSHSALMADSKPSRKRSPNLHLNKPTDTRDAATKTPETSCARPNVPATTLRAAEPDMPAVAYRQGIQGTVQVIVSLDASSQITATKIQSSPSSVLNDPALAAARQSQFQTEIRDCKPVASDYVFSVDFQSQ